MIYLSARPKLVLVSGNANDKSASNDDDTSMTTNGNDAENEDEGDYGGDAVEGDDGVR